MEHLKELRHRLIVSFVALSLAGVIAYIFYNAILKVLVSPLCQVDPKNCSLAALSPLDGLSIRVKLALYGGMILSSPVWTYELFKFITPGLTKREKRLTLPLVISAVVFFALGAFVAYESYPHALSFLNSVGGKSIKPTYTANNYVNLMLALMGIFGASFEFPVILVALEIMGVIKPETLSKNLKWALIGVTIAGGVLTPSSDPISMFALAVPLYIFYELAIVVGKIFKLKAKNSKAVV